MKKNDLQCQKYQHYKPEKINVRPIQLDELDLLIEFDQAHLLNMMEKIGVPQNKCAPPLTRVELLESIKKQDILLWLFADNQLAGYLWREKRQDCLFGVGVALKNEFYGLGLIDYIINLTEKIAIEANLPACRLTVIPMNGRGIKAYLRHGYQIVSYILACYGPSYPDTFRCIMERKLNPAKVKKELIDRCEVLCTDEVKLQKLLNRGYIGTDYINSCTNNATENKIIFELFETFTK